MDELNPDTVIGTGDPGETSQAELDAVRKCAEAYERAYKFDEPARSRYAMSRRYAAGTADPDAAVQTNLIGSALDVLNSFLFAKNPDVSARPAPRVEPDPQARAEAIRASVMQRVSTESAMIGVPPDPMAVEMQVQTRMAEIRAEDRRERSERTTFSKTIELVVSRLWKQGHLKRRMKKLVRSSMTNGGAWLKVIFTTDRRNDPQVERDINDLQDNLMRVETLQRQMLTESPEDAGYADLAEQANELRMQMEALQAKLEVVVRRYLAIDVIPPENMQVSLDVPDVSDYFDADWVANRLYVPKRDLRKKFPRLSADDAKQATEFYPKKEREQNVGVDTDAPGEKDAVRYGTDGPDLDRSEAFACVIEKWNRNDQHIYTWIAGVKKWAKEPYLPPQATSRFYPYFYLSFYDVDSQRHPQTLPERLMYLQDEYNNARSIKRLTRERAIPGMLFNKSQVDPDTAAALTRGVEQEWVGIEPRNPGVDLRTLFAEKPAGRFDPGMFDTTDTQRDMEKLSGVQESLQQAVVQPKTATEAEIQQSGFAARAGSDRDAIEEMLGDLAQYTTEVALQELTIDEVRRIAGPEAFWPEGMDVEDITTMVEVDIKAGTTGKPNTSAEREAWAQTLPLILDMQMKIMEARAMGNEPLAAVLIETLRETMNRMGDAADPERFIPEAGPPQPMMGAPAIDPATGVPMDPGAAPAEDLPPGVATPGVEDRLNEIMG